MNVGAIVGGAVGGVVFLALLALLIWLLCRRRKPQQTVPATVSNNSVYAGMLSEKPHVRFCFVSPSLELIDLLESKRPLNIC